MPHLAPSGLWTLPPARNWIKKKKNGGRGDGRRRVREQMTHRGSSAPSHPSGLEPGEVNRDWVCFPSKVISVCLAMARWPDLPYRSVLFYSQQYLESNPTGRQKREYKKALCTLHVHIGQEITWCKRTGITFKEDLSLGPSSATVLMNRKKVPSVLSQPLCFSYITYTYHKSLQIPIFLDLY